MLTCSVQLDSQPWKMTSGNPITVPGRPFLLMGSALGTTFNACRRSGPDDEKSALIVKYDFPPGKFA